METMRDRFTKVTTRLLEEMPRVALVLADIGTDRFTDAAAAFPERVINVGIREQAMIGVSAGLALEGLRPIVHSYAPFLVERPFEQLKIDYGHQGVGAILVSVGASHDWAAGGRTHHAPEDVALISTLPGWEIHVPGHPDEVEQALRHAAARSGPTYIRLSEQSNQRPIASETASECTSGAESECASGAASECALEAKSGSETQSGHGSHAASGYGCGRFTVLRQDPDAIATVLAVGPSLEAARAALADRNVNLLYASMIRPFDAATLSSVAQGPDVVLIEPYLSGTSSQEASRSLQDRPHRILALGVPREEHRRYGSPAEHDAAFGLDVAGIRNSVGRFLGD